MWSRGDDYENLAEPYVIFNTENDVLKAGLPIYHTDRTIKETGVVFGDEAHIAYVNSQIKDGTELGKLMHDFSCTDAKGVEAMCRAMEDSGLSNGRLLKLRNGMILAAVSFLFQLLVTSWMEFNRLYIRRKPSPSRRRALIRSVRRPQNRNKEFWYGSR